LLKDVHVKEYRIKILNVINKNLETIGKTQQYNWVIIQIITNISKKKLNFINYTVNRV